MSFSETILSGEGAVEGKEEDVEDDVSEGASSSSASSDSSDTGIFNSSDLDSSGHALDTDCSAISNFFGYWRSQKRDESRRCSSVEATETSRRDDVTQASESPACQNAAPPVKPGAVSRDAAFETDQNPKTITEKVPKMQNSVKPCGHGTIALSPRIPPPSSVQQFNNTSTPPGSPTFLKRKNKARNNSDGDISVIQPSRPPRKGSLQQEAAAAEGSRETVQNGLEEEECEKKNLINQEAKFQSQLNDLSKQLSQRDAEASKLRFQMEELQRDVFTKSAGMDRLQAELHSAQKESENVKQRLRNLEDDLQEFRRKNGEMSQELLTKTENYEKTETESTQKIHNLEHTIDDLRQQIQRLESRIEELKAEKRSLEQKHENILEEREKEKRLVETALQEALKEKGAINLKWEEEFEKLRTVSILKEQQMLDDFEWKLREVEKTCKNRLVEKDRSLEERLREACKEAEEKMKLAQEMMDEVEQLKTCKTEVDELKDKSQLQEKNMQLLKDQQEQMRLAESGLKDETKRLRNLIELEKENLQHMQRMHHQEIADKERWLQNTLDEKKTEIAVYWEEKLLHEIGRLKYELEQLYYEENHSAVENVRKQKEEEFEEAKKNWEKKIEDCFKEIATLKKNLDEKEEYYHSELMAHQTMTDNEIFELRRIMDKIDNAHHERFENLVTDHEKEIDKITAAHESKLKELEEVWQNQISALREKQESAKEQMEKESQLKIEALIQQHRSELDTQWANLVHQKSEAIKLVENEYVSKYQTLEEQFYTQQKSHEAREVELLKTIDCLKNDIDSKVLTMDDMQNSVDTLEGGVQVLHQEIAHQGEQLIKNRRDADQKIRGLQDVLMTLQALQEREREEFQNKLNQQQKQSQNTIEHLQKKCATLSKLFEEVRARYERRDSRQEDLNIISDLRQIITEQEKDMACMNEEKRYFQMQLMKLHPCTDPEDEEEFLDTEDFDGEMKESAVMPVRSHHPPPLSASLSIPPTIPECDDSDVSDGDGEGCA